VSRLGGDEFVVIAQDVARDEVRTVIARLEANLHLQNEQEKLGYRLSLSTGAVWIAHDTDQTIDELIGQADQAMYDNKRSRKLLLNSSDDAALRPAA
jgi:diguanylate cyclase (GGDEF)-like protein